MRINNKEDLQKVYNSLEITEGWAKLYNIEMKFDMGKEVDEWLLGYVSKFDYNLGDTVHFVADCHLDLIHLNKDNIKDLIENGCTEIKLYKGTIIEAWLDVSGEIPIDAHEYIEGAPMNYIEENVFGPLTLWTEQIIGADIMFYNEGKKRMYTGKMDKKAGNTEYDFSAFNLKDNQEEQLDRFCRWVETIVQERAEDEYFTADDVNMAMEDEMQNYSEYMEEDVMEIVDKYYFEVLSLIVSSLEKCLKLYVKQSTKSNADEKIFVGGNKMKKESDYSGWKNYETWRVWVEISDSADYWASEVGTENDWYEIGQIIKVGFENQIPSLDNVFEDLLQGALDMVEWNEIGEQFVGLMEELK